MRRVTTLVYVPLLRKIKTNKSTNKLMRTGMVAEKAEEPQLTLCVMERGCWKSRGNKAEDKLQKETANPSGISRFAFIYVFNRLLLPVAPATYTDRHAPGSMTCAPHLLFLNILCIVALLFAFA